MRKLLAPYPVIVFNKVMYVMQHDIKHIMNPEPFSIEWDP